MCVDCDTYEYSGNCGPECSAHQWEYRKPDADEDIVSLCIECRCVRVIGPEDYYDYFPFPVIEITKLSYFRQIPRELVDEYNAYKGQIEGLLRRQGGLGE